MKTPHKHAEIIKAWADGEEIQYRAVQTHEWAGVGKQVGWYEESEYRIKPEPKPDVVRLFVAVGDEWTMTADVEEFDNQNLKLTFDAETGKLKSAEVLK